MILVVSKIYHSAENYSFTFECISSYFYIACSKSPSVASLTPSTIFSKSSSINAWMVFSLTTFLFFHYWIVFSLFVSFLFSPQCGTVLCVPLASFPLPPCYSSSSPSLFFSGSFDDGCGFDCSASSTRVFHSSSQSSMIYPTSSSINLYFHNNHY
jgi:hypothetical protein